MPDPITDPIAQKGWCVADGATGELFEPMGTLTNTDTVAYFAEQADALAEGGADVIWIETMSSLEEVASAGAARVTGLPVCTTLTLDTVRRSIMEVTPGDYAQFAAEIGLDMAGAKSGGGAQSSVIYCGE